MRKIEKSIIIMMMVAFVAISANAQSVNTDINTRDFQACKEYLEANPNDTLVNVFNIQNKDVRGKVIRRVYRQGNRIAAANDTVWKEVVETADMNLVQRLDTVSINSRFVGDVYRDQPRDVIFAHSAEVAAYRDSINGDGSDVNSGKVELKSANKYGWSVEAHAGYSIAEGVNGPLFGAGLAFDRRWWGVYLVGEAGKSRYTSAAVNQGPYWTGRAESALMIRPFQLDKFDQNRLFVLGGIGFEHYKTDSAPDENGGILTSKGNYLYATAGLAFEHRFFATGNCLGVRLQWRNTRGVVQNSCDETFGSINLSVYFKLGFFRNKVVTK